ncbi:MAG: RecX family transcriptional regulator [Acidobacteriota bacterium]|nr:RecX family transcriptional regulator [Acidobacteriota bacterium]MDH3528609.1 RecX family transcriptional regulator [Acidobacteriota bacterium]
MRRYKPPIKDEDRVIKDPEKSRKQTFDRAVNLLTFKQRSVAELRQRLLEKNWTNEEIVDSVIEKLSEYNYLNDEEYAFNLASSKLRTKAVGKRRLKQDLVRKKLDKQTIEAAVEKAFEETPETELIERAVEKRLRIKGKPETPNEQKNFFAYLMRQGFEYDLIRDQMERLRS